MREPWRRELDCLANTNSLRDINVAQGKDFCSNDYLGLAQDSFLKDRLLAFVGQEKYLWPISSRLISGTTDLHLQSERALADFLDCEDSLIFSSSYMANLGVLSTLCKDTYTFSDQYNHASLIDGIKLSRADCSIYRHNDLSHLEHLLQSIPKSSNRVVVTESVFSMKGTTIDVDELIRLCERYQAFLILDEAHATGVFGPQGQGTLTQRKYKQVLTIHSGGKAIGVGGGFIGCSREIKKYLVNKCRTFIYTTALNPLMVWMLVESVKYIQQAQEKRDKLWRNITYAREQFKRQGRSPIFSFEYRDQKELEGKACALKESGFHVKTIRWPSVPKGEECLRISIHANHHLEEIKQLGEVLR